jgi:hypothetical protein
MQWNGALYGGPSPSLVWECDQCVFQAVSDDPVEHARMVSDHRRDHLRLRPAAEYFAYAANEVRARLDDPNVQTLHLNDDGVYE